MDQRKRGAHGRRAPSAGYYYPTDSNRTWLHNVFLALLREHETASKQVLATLETEAWPAYRAAHSAVQRRIPERAIVPIGEEPSWAVCPVRTVPAWRDLVGVPTQRQRRRKDAGCLPKREARERAKRTRALARLRCALIRWAKDLHFVDHDGNPAEWMMNVALGTMALWKINEDLKPGQKQVRNLVWNSARIVDFPSNGLLDQPRHARTRKRLVFEFKDAWSGNEPLEFFISKFTARLRSAADRYVRNLERINRACTISLNKDELTIESHCDWLIQNLVLKKSASQIAASAPEYLAYSTAAISKAIAELALVLGFQHRRHRGGRPPKT